MTANDLIERLAQTTYLDLDTVQRKVHHGLALGASVDDMAVFGSALPDAVDGLRMGLSVKQLLAWKDHLPLLILAVRHAGVRPSEVPDAPPV